GPEPSYYASRRSWCATTTKADPSTRRLADSGIRGMFARETIGIAPATDREGCRASTRFGSPAARCVARRRITAMLRPKALARHVREFIQDSFDRVPREDQQESCLEESGRSREISKKTRRSFDVVFPDYSVVATFCCRRVAELAGRPLGTVVAVEG